MLSCFRWYRRLMGGTWHHGDHVERWGFDAGYMSHAWMEARAEKTAEQKRQREKERVDAIQGLRDNLVKWRAR